MSLKCPACTQDLTPYRDDLTKLEIDSCFYCRGLWFDKGELRRFFSAPKLYKTFRLPENNFKVTVKDGPEVRVCTRCVNKALVEVTVADVTVDECPECKSVWLDAGEINRLIELYEEGKLKGKAETVKQIKKGHFDQGALGQAAKAISVAFRVIAGR